VGPVARDLGLEHRDLLGAGGRLPHQRFGAVGTDLAEQPVEKSRPVSTPVLIR